MSNLPNESKPMPASKPNETGAVSVQGHIKIFDPETQEVFIDKRNAIHYENFSMALAQSISNQTNGPIAEMVFGNGGSRVDPTGIITYLTPNTVTVPIAAFLGSRKSLLDVIPTCFNAAFSSLLR